MGMRNRKAFVAVLLLAATSALSGCRQPEKLPTSIASAPPASAPVEAAKPAPAAQPAIPTRDLSLDESMGGHTLSRHVGKSDAELRDRLRREKQISAASTYTDRETAERV